MKTFTRHILLSILLPILNLSSSALAQGTAFTYQGQLTDGGKAASGLYDFRFILYKESSGGSQAGPSLTNTAVAVSDGRFTVLLDFGDSFPGDERWLEIAVRTNGSTGDFTLLDPRQPVTATPYALTAGALTGTVLASQLSGKLPSANFGGTYSATVTFNNAGNSFTGNGAGLTNLTASALTSGTVPDARLGANVARTNQVWLTGGNPGTTAGTQFLGTTDDEPLEFKVNGARAMRLEPTASGAPNVIGGARYNAAAAGVVGATIAGGGQHSPTYYTNEVRANFATIGGGARHLIHPGSPSAVVSGGYLNVIGTNANSAAIGGGRYNEVGLDSPDAAIAGGYANVIGPEAPKAFVGGGQSNSVSGSSHAVVAGGCNNQIGADSGASTIGGGSNNLITASAPWATVAGGVRNTNSASYAVVGGGSRNTSSGDYATVAGGSQNASSDSYAAVGGGKNNICSGVYGTVGGGDNNTCSGNTATVAGGVLNTSSGFLATVGGGAFNVSSGQYATVPGGYENHASGDYSLAAGHSASASHDGAFVWSDSTSTIIGSTNANSVTMRASGGYRLFTGSGSGAFLGPGSGSWTSMSDRNAKENFTPVNSAEVLSKVATLPMTCWNYKSQDASIRHIGPMAQDFQAAFGVGESDTGITTIDADGVALAAIQGLNEKVEVGSAKSEVRLQQLEAENAELRQRLEKLEALLASSKR